jgi:glycosyltransferase involved in cell wall biosynthesis
MANYNAHMTVRVVSIISRMNIGGPAKLLADLINHIPEEEIEHILISGRCESDETDLLDTFKINSKIIYLDDIKRSIFLLKDLKSFFKLYLILRKLRPAIVHTHLSKAGVLGRIAAKISNPKVILIHSFHGHLLNGYFNKSKVYVVIGIEKFLSQFTNTLVAVSKDVRAKYSILGIGKRAEWVVINPGIRETTQINQNKIRKLAPTTKSFHLIWIGRFAEIKNPKFALEVFCLLQSYKKFAFQLTMIGDGKLLADCKKFAEDKKLEVNFTGWMPEVSKELYKADLLLFTSENEGFGMVAVEAALQDVLVVSTNCGGVTDFIRHKQTGLIVNKTPIEFTQAILEICAMNQEFNEIITNARILAKSEFSADSYVEKHLTLYRSFVENELTR